VEAAGISADATIVVMSALPFRRAALIAPRLRVVQEKCCSAAKLLAGFNLPVMMRALALATILSLNKCRAFV
jgi:hypothetical protein